MKKKLISLAFNKDVKVNEKANTSDIDIENELVNGERKKKELPVSKGMRTLKDMITPSGFDRSDENCIGVGGKYVRSYVVNGYPSQVYVTWLDDLFKSEEDIDVSYHIVPADSRTSLDDINMQIAKQEAQYNHEIKSGKIKNLGVIKNNLEELYAQRSRLEKNIDKMYHTCIVANLHADTKEELEKAAYKLEHTLASKKIEIMSSYLRQDDSYKSGMPFGVNYMEDKFRNMNTGGIVGSFPFYDGSISHGKGILMGLNAESGTPIFMDYFDRKKLPNGNMTVFGASGSGKTFLVTLMIMRSTIKGISTCVVDPEGEFVKTAKAVNGKHIKIAINSKTRINPFDIKAEVDPDTGVETVNVKNKIGDILNLLSVMAEGLDAEQRSVISLVIRDLYEKDFGITEDPKSLYQEKNDFNEETQEFVYAGVEKTMPTLSDFYHKLDAYVSRNEQVNLRKLVNSLTIYTKGNVYDLFDGQTSQNLKNLNSEPMVVFDVSKVEDDMLRPLAMSVTLTWLWESWIKADHKKRKHLVIDEAWMMCDPSMAGSEDTAQFLNTAARRCRKRNASLIVASQSFHEFVENPKGLAVLMNSSINMFLRTEPVAINAIQKTFMLSDGEREFLMSADKGQVLIRAKNESNVCYVFPFGYEKELIENPFASNEEVMDDDE